MPLRLLLAAPLLLLLACTSGGANHPAPTQRHTADSVTPPAGTTFANWPTYHGDVQRTGYARTMPTARGIPHVIQTYHLDGAVYASPLVINGRIVAATENDTVYAMQAGHVVWKRHLGTPVPQRQLPCGNIFPLGITGTPVYAKGIVYVVAEFASQPRHVLFAIRLSSGTVAWRKNIDLPGVETGAMQERGALLVAGGRVWVPFGGLLGDCGGYKGRVVGMRLDGTGNPIAYTVPTTREAGIWTPPGPVFGGTYLFVAVGNGASGTGAPYDHSDSILKISTSAHLVQSFSPSSWPADNDSDLDLGSQGPALVGKWVFSAGKRGTAYVLDRGHLGGIGGQVSTMDLCRSFGGTAVVGSRVYVPCTDGVRAVSIDASGHMHVLWHASMAITGTPIVGGGRVWALDTSSGVLHSLNIRSGVSAAHVSVGGVSRFATPAAYGRNLYLPTVSGVKVVATS
jgi:hypothetical protein